MNDIYLINIAIACILFLLSGVFHDNFFVKVSLTILGILILNINIRGRSK